VLLRTSTKKYIVEDKFSLDDSDVGCGGQLAASIIITGLIFLNTASNKSCNASTPMCGNNAADESLLVHRKFCIKGRGLCFILCLLAHHQSVFCRSYSQPKR
jgi:hypothetical protein